MADVQQKRFQFLASSLLIVTWSNQGRDLMIEKLTEG